MAERGLSDAFLFLKRGKYISFVYDTKISKKEKMYVIHTLYNEGKIPFSTKLAVERLLGSGLTKNDAIALGVK